MQFILTLGLTFIVVCLAMWVFLRIGAPVYRPDKDNIIALLELVLAGDATENDWQVFMAIPLRHNEALYAVQLRCSELGETEYIGGGATTLFSEKGMQALSVILEELKQKEFDT
ncbi:hypothetical protein A9Q89_03895 [Gammaproteobacteria bacterium 53_120_T64]|nr:hypothetical protein A9Q89_03895 [Gammaproteobacteria bacterium 53_120_T64]